MKKHFIFVVLILLWSSCAIAQQGRVVSDFNQNWKFKLNDTVIAGENPGLNDSEWRTLNLPHDWSIEYDFSENAPATPGGGALPGGLGWYRKSFSVSKNHKAR